MNYLKYFVLGLTPLPSAPALAQLKYPAPTLSSPTTIQLGTGLTVTKMDPAKDYIIECPRSRKSGSTVLQGGRNYILKGCYVTVPHGDTQQRAFYINGATGTVHIEGVLVDSSGGAEADAFAINAPKAIIQIQRTRVDGVRGTQSAFHGDILQPWGGALEIRVDRFTGSSYYQGFQLASAEGRPQTKMVKISRTNLKGLGTESSESGGYLGWFIRGAENCDTVVPARLENFYVKPRFGRPASRVIWPPSDHHPCRTQLHKGVVTFPRQPAVVGGAMVGGPIIDYAPAGSVGLAYGEHDYVWRN